MSVNKAILVGRLGRDPETRFTSGGRAEIPQQYLKKGMLVYIEGRIQTRQWEDKRDGQKRTTTEIVANVMRMLTSRAEGASAGAGAAGGPGGGAFDTEAEGGG